MVGATVLRLLGLPHALAYVRGDGVGQSQPNSGCTSRAESVAVFSKAGWNVARMLHRIAEVHLKITFLGTEL